MQQKKFYSLVPRLGATDFKIGSEHSNVDQENILLRELNHPILNMSMKETIFTQIFVAQKLPVLNF